MFKIMWIVGSIVFGIALVGFGDETGVAERLICLAGIPVCLYFAATS